MKQPEALRLAEIIVGDCAAELRRLHGEIESMRAERIYDIKNIKRLHEANQAMLYALQEVRRCNNVVSLAIAKGEAK
jgi:hypothetical protein